jgi:hypothetical protein
VTFRAADTETYRIKHRQLAPKLVCLSRAQLVDGKLRGELIGNGDAYLADACEETVDGTSTWHNSAYDLAVFSYNMPHLIPKICTALEEGRIHCTKVREKLLVLATGEGSGNLKFRHYPSGGIKPLRFQLGDLTKKYLNKNRDHEKGKGQVTWDEEDEDARTDEWRYNYDQLDGWKAADYPAEAASYATEDATDDFLIYRHQEDHLTAAYRAMGFTCLPAVVEAVHVATAYYLYMGSAGGVRIDLKAVERLAQWVRSQLSDAALDLLITSGVLRESMPERDRTITRRAHVEGCPKKQCKCPIVSESVQREHVEGCKKKGCSCPPQKAAPKKSSLNTAELHKLIKWICNEHGRPVVLTETGRVSASSAVLEELKGLHPTLDQYRFRQGLIGIEQREIPRMSAEVIHPHYNELVSTGRISCSASPLYPSGNITNVDPRARACYIPDAGWIMCSVDYSGMELVTLAQVMWNKFGQSSHRELIIAGVDLHGYLGAQIAHAFNPQFADACKSLGLRDRMEYYKFFLEFKLDKGTKERKFYDGERTMAKPTGLGYPGGLGPETFMEFALANYELKVDLEKAKGLRDVWYATHPDMQELYFPTYKATQKDHENSREEEVKKGPDKGEVRRKQRYWYTSPLGMIRRGCSYTEGVNGMGLQSPGAELAKLGVIRVYRAAFDPSQKSILYGRYRPLGFIHDEILGQIKLRDDGRTDREPEWDMVTAVAKEKARLMVEGGKIVVPDVPLGASPALQWVWDKNAEPVWDKATGYLMPWVDKKGVVV